MSKKNLFLSASIFASIMFTSPIHALTFDKPISIHVPVTSNSQLAKGQHFKTIMLMNIKLNAKEKNQLLSDLKTRTDKNLALNHQFPSSINLGMEDVPVLDQGQHGSCVTFAVTAAIDAELKHGDYVSQLCNLELGTYLENEGYDYSGWNGSTGEVVWDQILRFGYISKDTQKQKSCANISEYPTEDAANTGNMMTLDEFKEKSININDLMHPIYHSNFFKRFYSEYNNKQQGARMLQTVKRSLNAHHRLTFASFLLIPNSGVCPAGACATYHAQQDTWAVTDELMHEVSLAGHEMVIIGYDDNAVAVDQAGNKHQGLLILRNSWGQEMGDQGNYYMTYEFFKDCAFELQEVISLI